MFVKKRDYINGKSALIISGLKKYSLKDTFECGQCFRFVKLCEKGGTNSGDSEKEPFDEEYYIEYMTVVEDKLIFVGQRNDEELIFYGIEDEDFDRICLRYFALDKDYEKIREDIASRTDSEFLLTAIDVAAGIRILRQTPWETLFSFIVSQNNNIPRIKKIIRMICSEYGENLALKEGISDCPIKCKGMVKNSSKLDTGACKECGICYMFPSAEAVRDNPDFMLPSHPGFRYKYLVDAAQKVSSGEVDLKKITKEESYDYTIGELMKIKGVGKKVASCTALFAFSNLEAFPIDVWMRRAIDEYFDGNLDYKSLGEFAGVAQQYIFHYIRKLSDKA